MCCQLCSVRLKCHTHCCPAAENLSCLPAQGRSGWAVLFPNGACCAPEGQEQKQSRSAGPGMAFQRAAVFFVSSLQVENIRSLSIADPETAAKWNVVTFISSFPLPAFSFLFALSCGVTQCNLCCFTAVPNLSVLCCSSRWERGRPKWWAACLGHCSSCHLSSHKEHPALHSFLVLLPHFSIFICTKSHQAVSISMHLTYLILKKGGREGSDRVGIKKGELETVLLLEHWCVLHLPLSGFGGWFRMWNVLRIAGMLFSFSKHVAAFQEKKRKDCLDTAAKQRSLGLQENKVRCFRSIWVFLLGELSWITE